MWPHQRHCWGLFPAVLGSQEVGGGQTHLEIPPTGHRGPTSHQASTKNPKRAPKHLWHRCSRDGGISSFSGDGTSQPAALIHQDSQTRWCDSVPQAPAQVSAVLFTSVAGEDIRYRWPFRPLIHGKHLLIRMDNTATLAQTAKMVYNSPAISSFGVSSGWSHCDPLISHVNSVRWRDPLKWPGHWMMNECMDAISFKPTCLGEWHMQIPLIGNWWITKN